MKNVSLDVINVRKLLITVSNVKKDYNLSLENVKVNVWLVNIETHLLKYVITVLAPVLNVSVPLLKNVFLVNLLSI